MAETAGLLILAAVSEAGATGVAGFSLASTTIAGTSLATVVGSAAIVGASIGLQYALRPDIPKPEAGSQPLKQGIPPRILAYGCNRLAGYYMAFEAAGAYSFDVLAFHSGKIGGIRYFYLHDDEVHINGAGQPIGWGVRYGSLAIAYRLGNVPEVPYDVVAAAAGVGSIWTDDHRGDGIASINLVCSSTTNPSDFTKRMPRGLPQISAVADCALVWNPWDNTQSRSDAATWAVSYNPVVQLVDYLIREDGGMGLDFDALFDADRLAQWGVEAALCEEQVLKADGSYEPRYQCNGWFTFDTKPEDVINNILATCDGWMSETGDFVLKVGVYREPTVTITEKQIIGFSVNYGQPDEQMVNQLDISFTDPTQKYVEVQPDPYRDEDSISESGIVRAQQLSLKWVQSQSQAERLAQRAMLRVNPSMTGTFTTDLNGLLAIGERWIRIQYPFVSGLQDDVLEIQGSEIDLLGGKCTFQFNRVDEGAIEAYDPSTDEGDPVVVPDPQPPIAVRADSSTTTVDTDLITADYE